MTIGVILNRVFRTEANPLLEYIYQNIDNISTCYLIIPEEDLEQAATIKQQFYYGTLQHFANSLDKHHLTPFILKYEQLIDFCQSKEIDEVVMAGDIMSYHLEAYDILHQRQLFEEANIDVTLIRANHYFKPSMTMNKQGQPYKVFTSFYKQWRPKLRAQHPYHYQLKALTAVVTPAQEKISQSYISHGMTEQDAQAQWQEFLQQDIEKYDKNREYLPEVLTSQLSIALAHGLLDITEIINDLLQSYEEDEYNYEAFIRELMFREFYYILMTQYPETAHYAFKEKYRQIEWSYDKEDYERWAKGETGFPLVDAAMQELIQTGFMHNRMRMVVSQFLTKDLLIDWTWGEQLFNYHLIDYDAASNIHGWQWSASTGTDAVPYFRMFNPIRQSERFDKQALYIKTFLPILNDIDAKYLHDTSKFEKQIAKQGVTLGKDYPKQMIDHKEQRDKVMTTFKAIK